MVIFFTLAPKPKAAVNQLSDLKWREVDTSVLTRRICGLWCKSGNSTTTCLSKWLHWFGGQMTLVNGMTISQRDVKWYLSIVEPVLIRAGLGLTFPLDVYKSMNLKVVFFPCSFDSLPPSLLLAHTWDSEVYLQLILFIQGDHIFTNLLSGLCV